MTIDCPFKPENADKMKSVCKKTDDTCVLVIDSNGYVNPNYNNRARISTQGTNQTAFSFVINRLHLSDAGTYVCKAGDDSNGDKSNVDLEVLKPDPELLYGDLRGSVTFECDVGLEVAHLPRFLCREIKGKPCELVINTLGKIGQAFDGRILITPKEKGFFDVHITGLRKEDAGSYHCGAHSDGELEEGWPTQVWQLFVNEGKT